MNNEYWWGVRSTHVLLRTKGHNEILLSHFRPTGFYFLKVSDINSQYLVDKSNLSKYHDLSKYQNIAINPTDSSYREDPTRL